ncbi:DUF4893 domain-containing protein [Sphingomonas sp. DT-51]|uniref:DUF4893 domain-containing protein n=1 Tax=Sphingomonas sp. DT-51 TaxID=3396165 RepID=UPI003F1A8081
MRRLAAGALLLIVSTACGVTALAAPATPQPGASWRRVATAADRERLRGWRLSWQRALEGARRTAPDAVAAERELFDYDHALDAPIPPEGDYQCRMIKLGAQAAGQRDYVAYPAASCRIFVDERGMRRLETLGGPQRPAGIIYADNGLRAVFLGTLVVGDETRAYAYGREPARDLAGWIERVGPTRWRVALPRPVFESLLDVIELVPAR